MLSIFLYVIGRMLKVINAKKKRTFIRADRKLHLMKLRKYKQLIELLILHTYDLGTQYLINKKGVLGIKFNQNQTLILQKCLWCDLFSFFSVNLALQVEPNLLTEYEEGILFILKFLKSYVVLFRNVHCLMYKILPVVLVVKQFCPQ